MDWRKKGAPVKMEKEISPRAYATQKVQAFYMSDVLEFDRSLENLE